MEHEGVITKSLLFRDILKMDVYSRDNMRMGHVYDVAIRKNSVIGILIGYERFRPADAINMAKVFETLKKKKIKLPKRVFIKWDRVLKIKDRKIILRHDECKIRDIKKTGTFVAQKILDEQLINRNCKYIGRVDELQFFYSCDDRSLRIGNIVTGVGALLIRLGVYRIKGFGGLRKALKRDSIPWEMVKCISKKPPTKIMLKI
ncbi:MAG: hypothetical protein ABIA21_01975 [Candidatus Aenigmatarchaeota archaeon]